MIKVFCVMLGKYCQRLGLDSILLHFHIMTSQNVNLFSLTQYLIVIQFLSHQQALKLVRWLLDSNKITWIAQESQRCKIITKNVW